MKGVSCLLLLSAGLTAQPASENQANASAIRKLNSTLLTLKDGTSRNLVGRQLAADIASVADPDHRPSPAHVKVLADELAAGLPAGNLRAERLSQVTTPIVEVLQSAGTSTIGFYESVSRAEKALVALGVPAQYARSIAERLKTIGKQVRGPEGFPVDRVRPLMR
jgi:hypothetical protein